MEKQGTLKQLIATKEKYELLSNGVIDYDKFNHYSIVHHSSTIEGSSLSLDETFLLLDENLTPKNKPLLHTLMTVDHYNALQYIVRLAASKTKLAVNHINELSSLIMKNSGSKISTIAGDFDSSKGEFRKATVRTGNRTYMDYSRVPNKVKELVDFINFDLEQSSDFLKNSILAFNVHFQMVSIHPFADGNGRLSRLLMNYVQHYHKQPMTIVFKEDKLDYFQALEKTREKEDPKVFQSFMFDQSFKYFNNEIKILTKEQKQSQSKGRGMSFVF